MTPALRKRRRARALARKGHASPLLPILLFTFLAVPAIAAGATLVGALTWFNSLTDDYVPLDQKVSSLSVGLTEIYDRQGPEGGHLLGTLANPNAALTNPVPLERVSEAMIRATISTEDNSFYGNPGVDIKGLGRAAYENYVGGGIGSGSGGSTITQQLVKNLYLTTDCTFVNETRICTAPRTLDRKIKEIAIALEVNRNYSKDEILSWYLNSISYGGRYVGVEAAAQGYFHKSAADLTLAEAALLAGVPAAPTDYHPRLNCVRDEAGSCIVDELGRQILDGPAKARQEHVLQLMVEHGRATPEEVAEAVAETVYVYLPQNEQIAAAWIDHQVEPRLVRMCEAGMLPQLEGTRSCEESVHTAGYRVTTTLDWEKTQSATALLKERIEAGLADGCECHNASLVTIDPGSGQILIYVPNIDTTNTTDPKVAGNIDQAMEVNQPGSSFKPVVYLTWMDVLNKTPMSALWDTSPLKIEDPNVTEENRVEIVNPRGGSGTEGLITARAGLGGSQNVPAFRAAAEAGVDNVIAYAKKMGITTLDQHFDPTFYNHDAVTYGASIATGGANIRVVDMAYMNSVIANMGVMVGVPTLAHELDMSSLKSLVNDDPEAVDQKRAFTRGDLRLPGTRELDPVTVLEVRALDGTVLYSHGADLETREVVNPGSVWMVHSIMSDCEARFIIWGCGFSNDDLRLDAFVDGQKIPMGIKTGTQQGAGIADTLETWMNGYSRYAATALWVGNADNSLVKDGPSGNYAAANTTVRLFKSWNGLFHKWRKEEGFFTGAPPGFDSLQPENVRRGRYQSATTERGRGGGCYQYVETWIRTDIDYKGDCEGNWYMPLPDLGRDQAIQLAYRYRIPIRGYQTIPPPPTEEPTREATPPRGAQTPVPGGGNNQGGNNQGGGNNGGGNNNGGGGNNGGGNGNGGGGDGGGNGNGGGQGDGGGGGGDGGGDDGD